MRTTKTIYNEIIAQKETFSSLDGLQPAQENAQSLMAELTSGSKVAIWRLWAWIVAFAIYTHEVIVERLIAKARPGTLPWYAEVAKQFQFGEPLVFQNGQYGYAQENPDAQIITNAIALQAPPVVTIKVAKGTAPDLEPLDSNEFEAFKNYMTLKKFAGTVMAFITEEADILSVAYRIFYNPLVLAPDGSLLSDPSVKPVNDAIVNYLVSLPFGGFLALEKLDSEIKAVEGVENIVRISAQAKRGSLPYQDVMATSNETYVPFSGYMRISEDTGETLDDLLEYQPFLQ